MKVRAKHNIKFNGVWHKGGEVFEISTVDAETLNGMIDIAETPVHEEAAPEQPQKKRGRPKKTD